MDYTMPRADVHRLCTVLGVSESGYFAWKGGPASRRQNEDLILLAHIRAQFATSAETYGAPRRHVELTEEGLAVGRHRVARLMRDNGLKALQKRRYKKTTDSSHGGRADVRQAFYMPALVAMRFNPDLKAKYEKLVAVGKTPKTAITAIMRKILVLANALLRDGRKWTPSLP